MTTWDTQAASPSSKIAPRFFSAASRDQGRPIFPGLLWSSSSWHLPLRGGNHHVDVRSLEHLVWL